MLSAGACAHWQVIGMLVNKNEEQEYEKQYLSEAFEVELGRVVDEANELLNEARAQGNRQIISTG